MMRRGNSRRRVTALLTMGALTLAGCPGSMTIDRSKLVLPVVRKALDRMHDEIAAKGEGELYAGAALVDITTDFARNEGIYLGGFDMGRRNKGVRDPVFAHALYLDDGHEPLVLVSIDTIGYLNDDVRAVRELATDRFADHIIIAATHDHEGPDTVGYWGWALFGYLPIRSGRVPEYMETLKYLIAEAIDKAALSARPARLRFATANVDPTLSLNIHAPIRSQKDDLARVMLVEEPDGSPIAGVTNWGCHAESMWNDDQLSADWPGVFYRRWQAEVGGVPIFIEGALGGLVSVNPGDEKMKLEDEIMDVFLDHMSTDERLVLRDRIGNGLADAVIPAIRDAKDAFGPEGVSLSVASKTYSLLEENWIFHLMGERGLILRKVEERDDATYLTTDTIAARIRAGGEVVADIVTIPGEPAPPLVAEIDATSPAPFKLNVALGNDESGYMVRESDWDQDYYEYERSMSLGRTTGTAVLGVIRELRSNL